MMSFKRRPSEEPDRSFWAHGSRQQQDGLENREPRSRGQGSSLRRSRALSDTPGQDSKRSLPAPKEGLSCPTDGVPLFLEHNVCIWTEVVKKAVLTVQRPFQYPEEPQEQEGSMDEMRAAVTESPAHVLSSPTVCDPPLLDMKELLYEWIRPSGAGVDLRGVRGREGKKGEKEGGRQRSSRAAKPGGKQQAAASSQRQKQPQQGGGAGATTAADSGGRESS
ncbi:PREDICTED: uncharacterized protein LOC107604355 [Ficedula albicollis]|uniref:uncharacterized protein LOC107604355 n=1 Tax=Ficedula albicollis TaxID=59894 RepID=UPI0007AD8253|nr:PREDICTED: uncharacterized protein LOC107604355 [Ficedula albicollis]